MNGIEPSQPDVPQPHGTSSSDLVVFAGDYSHRTPAPLSRVADGTSVIAAGMVMNISEHGDTERSSATFHLENDFGQTVYAYVSPETLATFSLYLVNGMEVALHGIVLRPYPGARAPYIRVHTVEPLTD